LQGPGGRAKRKKKKKRKEGKKKKRRRIRGWVGVGRRSCLG
jgi:hypothetical protein